MHSKRRTAGPGRARGTAVARVGVGSGRQRGHRLTAARLPTSPALGYHHRKLNRRSISSPSRAAAAVPRRRRSHHGSTGRVRSGPDRQPDRARGSDARAHAPASIAYRAVADRYVAGGVASSWQDSPPHAIFIDRGTGNRIWDIDQNEYVDFHLGYGAMVAGHAHPKIVEAIQRQADARHALRAAHEAPRRGRGEPRRTLPAPAVALLQLGHRGHARGRAPDAREHRSRHARQDRGHLPRPPRLADVLGGARPGRHGSARAPGHGAAGRGHPAGVRRSRPRRAVQRPRGRTCACSPSTRARSPA